MSAVLPLDCGPGRPTQGVLCSHSRFAEDHSHVGVGAHLRQQQHGVLQLLITLLFLLLSRQRGILMLVIQKSIKQIFVLEMVLLVHYVKHEGKRQLLPLCLTAPFTRSKRMVSAKRAKWWQSSETLHLSDSASPRAVQLEDMTSQLWSCALQLSLTRPSRLAPPLSYENLPAFLR